MEATVIRPFPEDFLTDIQTHLREARRLFEGTPYHDTLFNRWFIHNPPSLKPYHLDLERTASSVFGEPVKASYSFVSMYGAGGICPGHIDRPQCRYTIDLCVAQRRPWEIYVGEDRRDRVGKPYLLNPGEALCYSGTGQWHYRNQIQPLNWITLAFFHFVPVGFTGALT